MAKIKRVGAFHNCMHNIDKGAGMNLSYSYLYMIDGYFIVSNGFILAKINMYNFDFDLDDVTNSNGKAISYNTAKKLNESKWREINFEKDSIKFVDKKGNTEFVPYDLKSDDNYNYSRILDGEHSHRIFGYKSFIECQSYNGDESLKSININYKLIADAGALWGDSTSIKIQIPHVAKKPLSILPIRYSNCLNYEYVNEHNDNCYIMLLKSF